LKSAPIFNECFPRLRLKLSDTAHGFLVEIGIGGALAGERRLETSRSGCLSTEAKSKLRRAHLEVGFIHHIGAENGRITGHERLIEGAIVAGSAGSRRSASASSQEPEDLRVQHVIARGQDILFAQVVVQLQEETVVVVGAQRFVVRGPSRRNS